MEYILSLTLKEQLELISITIGILVALYAALHRYYIKPKKEKDAKLKAKLDLIDDIATRQGMHDRTVDALYALIYEHKKNVEQNSKILEDRINRELDQLRGEVVENDRNNTRHVENIENKNQKLLELIIAYFTDKN